MFMLCICVVVCVPMCCLFVCVLFVVFGLLCSCGVYGLVVVVCVSCWDMSKHLSCAFVPPCLFCCVVFACLFCDVCVCHVCLFV